MTVAKLIKMIQDYSFNDIDRIIIECEEVNPDDALIVVPFSYNYMPSRDIMSYLDEEVLSFAITHQKGDWYDLIINI